MYEANSRLALQGWLTQPSPATFLRVGTCNTGEDNGILLKGYRDMSRGHVALVQSVWGDTVHGSTPTTLPKKEVYKYRYKAKT